jgi:hypothetical protein
MSEPENVFKTNKNILKYPPSVAKLYDTVSFISIPSKQSDVGKTPDIKQQNPRDHEYQTTHGRPREFRMHLKNPA